MVKGPWKLIKTDDWHGQEYKIVDANDEVVMLDTPYYPYMTMGDDRWNLVAAATEILSALEKAYELLTDIDLGFPSEKWMDLEEEISSAISKAKGEA